MLKLSDLFNKKDIGVATIITLIAFVIYVLFASLESVLLKIMAYGEFSIMPESRIYVILILIINSLIYIVVPILSVFLSIKIITRWMKIDYNHFGIISAMSTALFIGFSSALNDVLSTILASSFQGLFIGSMPSFPLPGVGASLIFYVYLNLILMRGGDSLTN